MRILICDDDILIAEQLNKLLQDYFKKKRLKEPEIVIYDNGESLLSDTNQKDIVFLDVEMPGVDGIFVGQKLKKANENVIIFIVTSYLEYLDDAMRFHVFRYLTKPLDAQRFYRNLTEALQLYNSCNTNISIETKEMVYTIPATDIVCIEAHGRNVTVHTSKKDFESIHTMQFWLETLTMPCFFSSHRSFLINMKHVTAFDHSLIYLCDNQFRAYLTRRKYTQFKEIYLLYLESTR